MGKITYEGVIVGDGLINPIDGAIRLFLDTGREHLDMEIPARVWRGKLDTSDICGTRARTRVKVSAHFEDLIEEYDDFVVTGLVNVTWIDRLVI